MVLLRQNWHHMMLVLASMVTHVQKSHVAPHFDPLDLRNAILLLIILWALRYPCAKGITGPISHFASQFNCLPLRNAMVPLMTPLASGDTYISARDFM